MDDDVREGLMRHVEKMNKNWAAGTHYIVLVFCFKIKHGENNNIMAKKWEGTGTPS